jgi:hypothetical protein
MIPTGVEKEPTMPKRRWVRWWIVETWDVKVKVFIYLVSPK